MRKILYLNSSKASNNVFTLDEAIEGRYKLVGFSCTNNIYNVNDSNNKIPLNENGVDLVATITNGYYEPTEFESAVSSALGQVCVSSKPVARNTTSNKLTITSNLPFYFRFESETSNTARKLLGFNESDGSSSSSQVGDLPIDLNPYKSFFINITDNDGKAIEGPNYFHTSLLIQGSGGFGEILRYIPDDNFKQYVKFNKSVKRLEVKFHDLNEDSINLNSEYEIILEKV